MCVCVCVRAHVVVAVQVRICRCGCVGTYVCERMCACICAPMHLRENANIPTIELDNIESKKYSDEIN